MNTEKEAAVIDVKNLYKSFAGRPAVAGTSLTVHRGEIFGFLGPNGGGKTTTIRMLCGLLVPDKGEGTCLGFDIIKQSYYIKERVGYMTQNFSLYEELTIRENLDFVAHLYQTPNRRQLIDKHLLSLGLSERQNQLVKTLSGGWKQRLALTAALLHSPQLLLLDEPTAGIDPKARREFWEHLHNIAMHGTTILVSTHYMDEAERCSRIAYMSHGRILAYGNKEEVIAKSKLTTVEIIGENLQALAEKLRSQKGVEQIATFPNALRVSSKDGDLLKQTLLSVVEYKNEWNEVKPNFEDIFITLVEEDDCKKT